MVDGDWIDDGDEWGGGGWCRRSVLDCGPPLPRGTSSSD